MDFLEICVEYRDIFQNLVGLCRTPLDFVGLDGICHLQQKILNIMMVCAVISWKICPHFVVDRIYINKWILDVLVFVAAL